ncbi:hypothetical protein Tsubulata_041139, partial [Turnera subulata]
MPLLSLHYLSIRKCNNFISFPGQGLRAPNLMKLHLKNLTALEGLPKHMHSLLPSLTELTLENCAKLRSFPEGGLPSSIQILGLEHLSSLSELKIFGCPELQSLPEEGLPSSLQYLAISGCPKTLMKRCQENGGDRHKISHIPWIVIG